MSRDNTAQLDTPGRRFRQALALESPLQLIGVINAYCARLADRAGYRALYVSGAGVANASFGIPDLGATTLSQVAEDVSRIASITPSPIIVDADTGWHDPGLSAATLAKAGAAGLHIEDQVELKRCGHRPNKRLVSTDDMIARLRAVVAADTPEGFYVIARTDAVAVESVDAAIERAQAYCAAGADAIFAEALTTLKDYERFVQAIDAPVLANITEFGRTPLFTLADLRGVGIRIALYPLTAFRAMSKAAEDVYATVRQHGTQTNVLKHMQTRDELYAILDYHAYETAVDETLTKESHHGQSS
ncbi:MAG: methylisocitrate lyase [Verrucomicrobia bacterium]|nr:methylisocitrate lyase [Verrucomicrobiota bacterium]